MATLTQSPPSACIVRPRSAKTGWLARVRVWRAHRRAYAETMAALAQLDARDLHDLAVSRADFDAIARGTYRS
jgi:uncharacterized protein YjiS (DUF1127 family)